MRGRKPKPSAIKRLTGNPGRHKIKAEPKIGDGVHAAGLPTCPPWLDDHAKELWAELVPGLNLVLTAVDQSKLACFCQAVSDVRAAVETLRKSGHEVKSKKGIIAHPAVARKNKAMLIVAKFGSDFGLDPASRSRLTVPDKTPEASAEDVFFGAGGMSGPLKLTA